MSSFTELGHQYIDGQWRTGSGSWDIVDFNPYNGEKLTAIPVATTAEVDAAYEAAARAQPAWAAADPADRRRVFERMIQLIDERADEIVAILTDEIGGVRPKALQEIRYARDALRQACAQTVVEHGHVTPSPDEGRENRLVRRPVGVVTVLLPFNAPFVLAIVSLSQALAHGNACVLKPNQNAPVAGGGLVARLFEDAGLAAGLLNVVITDIAEIGDALIEHPVPKVISFAGSDRVGRHIAEVAARNFKRTVLQMSSNAPLLVLDDVRGEALDRAVEAAVFSRFLYSGQICMSANRILVDRAVEEEFTEKFVRAVSRLKAGDPRDPDTFVGPLVNAIQVEVLEGIVQQALDEGATALLHGKTYGSVMEPTVLTGLPAGSPVLRQEILGPVAVLASFDGDDEGVRLANDSPYGLSAAVHSADPERAARVASRLTAGMVHVNDATVLYDATVVFGGEGASGLGRLNAEGALEAFTTPQWVSVRRSAARFPLS